MSYNEMCHIYGGKYTINKDKADENSLFNGEDPYLTIDEDEDLHSSIKITSNFEYSQSPGSDDYILYIGCEVDDLLRDDVDSYKKDIIKYIKIIEKKYKLKPDESYRIYKDSWQVF